MKGFPPHADGYNLSSHLNAMVNTENRCVTDMNYGK